MSSDGSTQRPSDAIRRLTDAMQLLARHIDAMARAGESPLKIDERASLMQALTKELRRQLDDTTGALDADLLANALIERARNL
jgi:hypothetical protein